MLPCPSSPTAASDSTGSDEKEAQKVKTECIRLTEERDEAERQLKHIKRVSQMVIEEVSVLQTQLEIEKSCRENAEALATKLNCENKKLKYLSLSSRPCLDELLPSISDCIALDEESEPQETSPDPYAQYQQQVKDLQEMVNALLEEKKQLGCQLKEQQREIEELTSRREKDQLEIKELQKTMEQQNRTIKKFNRVSMMAAQEYEGLREQLDLEQSLRQKAESYAHEMLVKQKEANRQSMVLLQQSEPSLQLLKALEDLAHLTKTLEQERLQHQQKVKALEVELEECALRRQLAEVQKQMELLEEEKREVESRLQEVEKQNKTLENRVQELLEAPKKRSPAHGPPQGLPLPLRPHRSPPPPPHLRLRLPPPSRCNPLSSLIAIMRKSSKSSKGPLKMEPAPPSAGMDDVKVKAVNEMMERIKHGVVLRPVKGQDTKIRHKASPAGEEKQQESAMEELKGILVRCEDVINPAAMFAKETVKRSPSRGFPEAPPSKRDSELEVILRRRRKQACDATAGGDARSHGDPTAPTAPRACPETTPNPPNPDEKDSEISKVSSSESLNARHSSDSGKEAWGPRRGGSTRSSSSDKGISELFANGSCDSGEEEKTNEEKPAPAESNGENHTVLNQEKQAMLTPASPDGVSPLIGGTDAEC